MRRYFLYRPTWIEFNKIKLGQAFLLLAGRLGGRSRSREGEFLANIEIKIYDAEHLYNPHFPLLPRPTTAYQFYKYIIAGKKVGNLATGCSRFMAENDA